MSNFSICRSCGRQIMWIKTKAGKNMPCDPEIITYKAAAGGRERIVTTNGEVRSAELVESGTPGADGFGYISHFATCTNAGRHRRK